MGPDGMMPHACIMLFHQRLPAAVPFVIIDDQPLATSPYRRAVLSLVERLGIAIS
ncbi:hypothetical protein [Burkholderia sp. WAC0059]|uniref:hypothetical protein n=1 Tax=Burkholderia sp. WAC0059 TaxID=2066022 RepID=UPI0015E06803|nr:hypothetical protein [Burkholderia sp. WAC0059]